MIRNLALVALCLSFGVAPALAVQQPAAAAQQAPATEDSTVDLSTDPARLFPERLGAYVDITHLGTVIDGLGVREALFEKLNAALAPPAAPPTPAPAAGAAPRAEKPAALTSRELSTLLDSSVTIGVFSSNEDGVMPGFGGGSMAAVVKLSSTEAATMFCEKVLARYAAGDGEKAAVRKVHGLDVTAGSKVWYALSGRYVLVGSPDAFQKVVETAASRKAARIGDDPGFNSSLSKHTSGQDQVLAFLPGRTVGDFVGALFGLGIKASTDVSSEKRPDPARDAMRAFAGLDAIKGVAIGARVENGTLKARYDLEVDRSVRGLISALADPPPISFRSVGLLPGSTEQVQLFSVDIARIFDLLDQSFGSLPPSSPGASTFSSEVAEVEQYLGMSVRSDLLPALGTEVGYTGTLDSVFGSRGAPKGAKRPISVFFAEVVNPDVIRTAIGNVLSGSPGVPAPAVPYKGVDVWSWSGLAITMTGGFAIVGSTQDVQACIDAQQAGETLVKRPEFSSVAANWHGDTLYATYLAPTEQTSPTPNDAGQAGEPLGPSMFLRVGLTSVSTPNTIYRDGTGVHWENSVPVDPMVAGMNEAIGALLAPANPNEKDSSHDSAVIDVLQTAALAEAMFHSKANRYGTLEELMSDPDVPGSVDVSHIAEKASKAGYRFVVTPIGTGDGARFEITATPIEYAKPAKVSYFIDQSFVVRAADKQGAPASADDAALAGESDNDDDDTAPVEDSPVEPTLEDAPQ